MSYDMHVHYKAVRKLAEVRRGRFDHRKAVRTLAEVQRDRFDPC